MGEKIPSLGELETADDEWHHLEVTMAGSSIQGVVFDGETVFGTEEFLDGRDEATCDTF